MRLKGKRALVTAAGAGIGRATALAFAAEGAEVIATDINADALADLASGRIGVRRLDVTDPAAVDALAAEVGALDILFNCAGIVQHGTILECDDAALDAALAINVRGTHRVTRAFLPAMLAGGGGSIIAVASAVSSMIAAPNRFAYGATKAAVIGMMKSVAADFVTRGIRATSTRIAQPLRHATPHRPRQHDALWVGGAARVRTRCAHNHRAWNRVCARWAKASASRTHQVCLPTCRRGITGRRPHRCGTHGGRGRIDESRCGRRIRVSCDAHP